MKRKVALLIAGILMMMSLSACSSAKNEPATESATESSDGSAANDSAEAASTEESTKLTIAWWGNQTRNERTQAALDLYSKLNPAITFDGQFAEWNDYWTRMATASAGQALPDIIQMDYKYLAQYVNNNLLVDLSPYISDGTLGVSDVNESIVNSGKVGEGVYAVSLGINSPALLYNKTLLDANGITLKDNMTMDEFLDVCREVYKKTGYKTNITYNNNSDNFLEYLLRAKGENLYESGKLSVGSAADFEGFFNLYETGIKEGWHVDPSIFSEITIGSVEQDPMVYGSSPDSMSWCAFVWSNQLTAMQSSAPEGTEIGITTWPSDDPIKSNYLKPAQFFALSVNGENQAEAAKVLDFWTNSEECNDILLGERGVPVSQKVSTAIESKMNDTDQKVFQYINDVVTPNSSQISPAGPEGSGEIVSLINKLEEQLCYGEIDAKTAAQQLFDEGNDVLKIVK